MKILVIRFSSLGDLVLMTPLLAALREGFPGGEVHLATKEKYAVMFQADKNVDRIFTIGGGGLSELLRLRSELGRQGYDVIIDAHHVIRSNILYHSLRAPQKVQIKKEQRKLRLIL